MNPTYDLTLAIVNRNPEGVLAALQAGANPNARYASRTPLGILSEGKFSEEEGERYAADRYEHWLRHAQCVRILIENGGSLDVPLDEDRPEETLRLRLAWYKSGLPVDTVYLEGALEAEMSLMLGKDLGEAPAPRRKRL